jgi:hypothetical protein
VASLEKLGELVKTLFGEDNTATYAFEEQIPVVTKVEKVS